MSRPAGWLRDLHASGELARVVAECSSWAQVAARLGTTYAALRKAREYWRRNGGPDIVRTMKLGEAPMQPAPLGPPPAVERWSNVAAFDRGEMDDPPLPSLPSGHAVRGVSTLVGPDGAVKAQWIKTSVHHDERADWLAAIRDMGGELPHAVSTPEPEATAEDLCVVLPVGDPHIGLLSWGGPDGDAPENFDLNIAEQRYTRAFEHLIALAPTAAECLLVFIGDTAHADGQTNTTTKGTRVDVDGRIVKVARTILRIIRRAVSLALGKFGRVTVIVERGNHDEMIAAMLSLALAQHYEDEQRVCMDQSPAMFHWFRFGKVLIGTHHGDKVKPIDLLGVMAVDQAAAWSECTTRRFYLGHYHHQIVKEVPGLVVEYLPTLATSDAWHHSMGYRSARACYLDVFHREHGHINRHIVGVEQLR